MLQLGYCSNMNARISQRQCDINRNGLRYRAGHPDRPAQHPRQPCLLCVGCPGLDVLQTTDVQLMLVSKPAKAAPVAAMVPVLPATPAKRGGGNQKPCKQNPQRRRL